MPGVCARRGTERARCKSSCQVFAEPKARKRARASTARWGLEEAQSKRAGRRTGTGYEVWCTRDERARDREVLHPQGVCLIHPASTRGTFGVVPWEICRLSRGTEGGEIRPDRPAEVSRGHTRRSDTATRRNPHGRTRNPPCRSKEQGTETLGLHGLRWVGCPPLKARTVPREGLEGKEWSRRVERWQGIREAA